MQPVATCLVTQLQLKGQQGGYVLITLYHGLIAFVTSLAGQECVLLLYDPQQQLLFHGLRPAAPTARMHTTLFVPTRKLYCFSRDY